MWLFIYRRQAKIPVVGAITIIFLFVTSWKSLPDVSFLKSLSQYKMYRLYSASVKEKNSGA
jgi:hypothetical protein